MIKQARFTAAPSTSTSILPDPGEEAAAPQDSSQRSCSFRFRSWNGIDHWHCDPCGISTFDRDTSSSTKCKRDGMPALNPDN